MIPIILRVLSVATLCLTLSTYADDGSEVSPTEFQRYQSKQKLELEQEQALHAERNAPKSPEETRRQRRRFEAECFRQRQLLEHQRRWVAAERARARSRPSPHVESSRGSTLQRLRREQASERLSRKLLR